MLCKLNFFCLSGAINMAMDGSVLEEKSSFKMLGLCGSFSSKLDWRSYISAISRASFRKMGILIPSIKFLSPKVAHYFYKSTIQPCIYMSGLMLPAASWKLLVLHLLPHMNPWLIVKMLPAYVFSIGISLADVHMK